MNGDAFLILLLLVAVLILWLFYFGPKTKEARAAELARLRGDREELLRTIRSGAPGFILRAIREFQRDLPPGGGEGFFGQEMSPLVCFGYRVGKTNGRTETERHAILEYAIAADLDTVLPFLPAPYRSEWGAPLSVTRFNRIYSHLNKMADLRDGRRNFETAVKHWRADAEWLKAYQRKLVERFRGLA